MPNQSVAEKTLGWLKTSVDDYGQRTYSWAHIDNPVFANAQDRLNKGYHEVNFGYLLAKFAASQQAELGGCIAGIATNGPKFYNNALVNKFDLVSVRNWIGKLPKYDSAATPKGLRDVVLLAPEGKLSDRRREFPQLEVQPIKFSSGELGAESWKFLLGAYGNDSFYVKQIVSLMRRHREALTFQTLRDEIANADLPPQSRRLSEDRLALAEPYIDDSVRLMDLIRPGRTIIVDLRDPWIEKDEALGLFVVMMKIFAAAQFNGKSFNKLVVFDEAHKYISESDLVDQVVQTIREMRHQATSVVIASQDPLSVPRAVVELTSVLLLHRMTSPQWLKHLKGAISALDDITEAHLSGLKPGEALVWAQRSTDARFTQRPYKVTIRPRFSFHGGGTKTAVTGYSVR